MDLKKIIFYLVMEFHRGGSATNWANQYMFGYFLVIKTVFVKLRPLSLSLFKGLFWKSSCWSVCLSISSVFSLKLPGSSVLLEAKIIVCMKSGCQDTKSYSLVLSNAIHENAYPIVCYKKKYNEPVWFGGDIFFKIKT